MPDRVRSRTDGSAPAHPLGRSAPRASPPPPTGAPRDDAVLCDRCGTGMFRMHAVWRCPECGYKTDCCGW